MKLTEALVLDMDDTLYLERDYVYSGFAAIGGYVSEAYGITDFGGTCWSLFMAGARGDTFNKAAVIRGLSLSKKDIDALVGIYRDHRPAIHVDPNVRSTLMKLSTNYRLVLFTGGPPLTQQRKCDALELAPFFESIFFTGRRGKGLDKPHPQNWIDVEQLLRLPGREITCIGDNPLKDIVPSLERGWHAIRVRMTHSLHQGVDTPHSVTEISSIADLLTSQVDSVDGR